MANPCRRWSSLAFIALGAAVAVHAQRPAFRAAVDLISLTVTVTGPGGRQVNDLSAGDFDILEDGRSQELAFFSRAETAVAVSLLLDTSSSMEARMPLAQKAATEFVARLRPSDVAEVVDFDGRVAVLQSFTADARLLQDAIGRMVVGGATALYNAIYITLRQFEKIRPQALDQVRREVVVVLSDGEDTSSLVSFDEVVDLAKRSQAVIYTIGLGLDVSPARAPSQTRAGSQEGGEFALRRLAQETGGRLFVPKRPEELSDIYTLIADELSNQYVLGYLSRNDRRDSGWRNIAVRVRRPQLQARTRTGYYGTASR